MNTKIEMISKRKLASQASGGISNNVIYSTFEKNLNQLGFKNKNTILDFGAGTGNLTKLIYNLNQFKFITATDIMSRPNSLNDSIKWISTDLNNSINLPSESFDCIVSAEVIEHLENPRSIIREWFRLLKFGGSLIFSTPNNESYRSLISLIFKGHYAAFSDLNYPAHITPLLRKDIQRILKEAEFSEPKFVFTDFGMIPKLTYISWQQISGGLLKGLRYSDNLLVITQKINTTSR